jgi:hypothetical protein
MATIEMSRGTQASMGREMLSILENGALEDYEYREYRTHAVY